MPSSIPRMSALLDDPVFRAYMKRIPAQIASLSPVAPYQMWIETPAHKWLTADRPTYADAWKTFLSQYRAGNDPTIVSRRTFFAPPGEWYTVKVRDKSQQGWHRENRWRQTWFWQELDLSWCGRCRRPVYWMPLFDSHHALRRFPAVTEDDNYRCVICGIRWIAQPDISQMTKVEKQS